MLIETRKGDIENMKLKVGLFSDAFPPNLDGVSNVVLNYARQIQERYGEAVVAAPFYKDANDDYDFDVVRYHSIKLMDKMSYRAGNPYDLKSLKRLRKRNMDLIHVHSPFSSSVLARMLQVVGKRRVPIVFTYHTKYNIDFEERIDSPLFRRIATEFIKANIKSADEVWVVSEGAGENLKEIGYYGDYRVMENGTDFVRGRAPDEAVNRLRAQYAIKEGAFVFLFVGRMMWYKNCRLTLDALRVLYDAGLHFRMFMVGDGFEREEIEDYAREIGLAERVVFTGAISDRDALRAFYTLADLFIFPSTFDTSGLVVKEAAACDCPSLLLEGSCASEGVEDGVSGYIAEEETPLCCATRILQAVNDREKLHAVGAVAGERVYLSWDEAVAKAYKRYEEIMEEWKQGEMLPSKG